MTTAAICATTREVSCRPSFYRGEQYDPDLGLYYLRARYYNPATGRFMSRDPEDGKPVDPRTLHKYLYAAGDPVNAMDPRGREEEEEEEGAYKAAGVATTEEIKQFIAGPVLCAFGFDAYVIGSLNGANAMDATLGGLGLAAGCAVLLW
jgi:RHS repeat-associated protein